MKKILIRALVAVLVCLPLLTALPIATIPAEADTKHAVPYHYAVDDLNGHSAFSTMISVIRDLHLPLGESIRATGWLATDEGVAGYEYLWLPAGGGIAEWKPVTELRIEPRPDLAGAGIGYVAGHGTAGYTLSITPPEHTAEGIYDVYIRGVDGMGNSCDLVALLNLRYGEPDVDTGERLTVSFPRIRREGNASKVGNPVFEENAVVLSGEQMVRLGDLNLTAFALMRISYEVEGEIPSEGRRPILGLKSHSEYGYGTYGGTYNLTNDLIYAALIPGENQGTLEIDLTACDYDGDVWLTGYLEGSVRITSIELVYKGYTTSRVAAKINLSGDLVSGYFAGFNRTSAYGVTDPVLGDVLRFEVSEETNDPYAFFNAGALLKDNGLLLDADDYKYMVILYRAEACNNSDRMNFYLCAGNITGATEACNQGETIRKDGQWHYQLIDLSQKENWGGIINGWRFDYISSTSDVGDAVEFASVQFFRTFDAAMEAASEDPLSRTPYHSGDPAVIRDMREEMGAEDPDYVISPEDAYVVTEPEAELPTEPETAAPARPDSESTSQPEADIPAETETEPSVTTEKPLPAEPTTTEPLPDSPESTSDTPFSSADTTAPPSKQGCSSALAPLALVLLTALIPVLLKKSFANKGDCYET